MVLGIEECRDILSGLNLSDEEIINLCDHIEVIVDSILDKKLDDMSNVKE